MDILYSIIYSGLSTYTLFLMSYPIPLEGILRGVFQNFNPLCRRNPIETDLD